MNAVNNVIAALGGASALAALVAALTTYLKSRAAALDRKKENSESHKRLEQALTALSADVSELKTGMQNAVAEASALRVENTGLKKDNKKLEKNLTAALALQDKPDAEQGK